MMHRRLALALLLVAACGGDDSTADTGSVADGSMVTCDGMPGCVLLCEGGDCSCYCMPDAGMDASADADAGRDADASLDADAAGDACVPRTNDLSAMGRDCSDGSACPDGYTCQSFGGAALTQSCQILCNADCECPDTLPTSCVEMTDKAGSWRQCARDKI